MAWWKGSCLTLSVKALPSPPKPPLLDHGIHTATPIRALTSRAAAVTHQTSCSPLHATTLQGQLIHHQHWRKAEVAVASGPIPLDTTTNTPRHRTPHHHRHPHPLTHRGGGAAVATVVIWIQRGGRAPSTSRRHQRHHHVMVLHSKSLNEISFISLFDTLAC